MKRIITLLLLGFLMNQNADGQINLEYQKPSKEILDLVDVKLAPYVLLDDEKKNMILIYRDAYESIEDLSREELRLGGLRIDPKTNIGSRVTFYNNVKLATVEDTAQREVKGLPENPRLSNFNWSPDQSMLAMTHTTHDGVEVWVLDIAKGTAKRISEARVNANLGDPISWFNDGKQLLVKYVPADRKELINTEEAVPTGPTISVNEGSKAQNRTYQDLLKNPNDEHNFEQLSLSELKKISLDGKVEDWKGPAMYREISFSPDGKYVMIAEMKRPFSYIVTYYRFPTDYTVYTTDGKLVKLIESVPLTEEMPQGFMASRMGKRSIAWRADEPATIHYVEALDEGDPEKEAEFRDEFFLWKAPFKSDPRSVIKLQQRYAGMDWGNENTAIIYDYWWNTRNVKTYLIDPSKSDQKGEIIYDRNYQDRYSDPGDYVTKRNEYGRSVMVVKDNKVFLLGDGYSEEGQFPFLDEYDLTKKESKRLYQSAYTDKVESLRDYQADQNRLLVRIESPTEYPNYYFRNLAKAEGEQLEQLTDFENPFKSMMNVHKEVINYKRDDGLDLSATLYLPVGYDKEKKEKMPMILWAYPQEFKDKSSAGQNTQNPNEFIYPYYGSPIYWVTKGYVVLDDAAFPIVGEGEEEPNDSFRKQLVANAKAAIDAVDELGYIDRNRVGVGGHSYGAFMVANLLSHSDLFAAGIARSGAYNRTLTPFGFQSEERHYWDAPEVYYNMSPFMHADKMDQPLLLVHGEADNNSGTYPMQSERYFNALKGLGATVRLVILPKESHGYRAKESILHLLWEQDQWLEKYVKNKTEDEDEDGEGS
ncbi:MAG: S9 family peptidase [Flavobacteriales bacterium]|nr:S9 family peptidase [Flavobacteriales bacterium]